MLDLSAERRRGRVFTRDFLLVCLTSTADAVNGSFFLPTLPLLIISLGGGNADVGIVVATYSMVALASRMVIGPALDRHGRKPFLVVGVFFFLAANLLYFTASSALSVMLLRTFQGVGFGIVGTTVSVLIADLVPVRRRGEAMGYFSIFAGVPQAIAPAIALWLIAAPGLPLSGFRLLFATCCAVATIELIFALLVGETRHLAHRGTTTPARISAASFFSRDALPMATTMFFTAVTYSAIAGFLPLYLSPGRAENISVFFFVNSTIALISRPFIGLLSDRIGRRLVLIALMLFYALGTGILAISPSLPVVLLSAVFFGLGFGSLNLILNALVVDIVSPERRGPALATFTAGFDIGISVGSLAFGFIAGLTGYRSLFVIAGGVAVVGIAHFLVYQRSASFHGKAEVASNPVPDTTTLSSD